MSRYVMAMDQGTTSSRAVIFGSRAEVVASAHRPLACRYPAPGWVEQDPYEIVVGQVEAAREALQHAGSYLVVHQLKHASDTYGLFALVIGTLAWLHLGAQMTLYAAELNVVRSKRLWPRAWFGPPQPQAAVQDAD